VIVNTNSEMITKRVFNTITNNAFRINRLRKSEMETMAHKKDY